MPYGVLEEASFDARLHPPCSPIRFASASSGWSLTDRSTSLVRAPEIENQVRRLIDGAFSPAELAAARHPGDEDREVEGVADLTFGEYGRLLETPDNWARLNLDLDRKRFVGQLQRVRRVRKEVMHFNPDGTSPEDLELLRDTVRFLQQVH